MIGILSIFHEIALKLMPHDHTDDKSTLVQVMVWTTVYPDLCRHMAPLGHNELELVKTSKWVTEAYIPQEQRCIFYNIIQKAQKFLSLKRFSVLIPAYNW